MTRQVASPDDVHGYVDALSNWGRWGADDQRGTLNLVTPDAVGRGAALVRRGITVSCSRIISDKPSVDVVDRPLHHMTYSGERFALNPQEKSEFGIQLSRDFIGMMYHGAYVTHLDALCHIFTNGQMYNGLSAAEVTTAMGALRESVDLVADGIASRGVLLDIPPLTDRDWLELSEPIFPEDLIAAEEHAGVRVEPGDILFVRTGYWGRRAQLGPVAPSAGTPGLHAECLPWLRERGVAVLCGDTMNDVVPSGYAEFKLPVHEIGQVGMGLWLMDNCDLESLSKTARQLQRWEFQVVLAPLRIEHGTGSPLNPIALF